MRFYDEVFGDFDWDQAIEGMKILNEFRDDSSKGTYDYRISTLKSNCERFRGSDKQL